MSSSPTPKTSTTSSTPKRTFETLVLEEIPLQRASVEMEGGMPSCISLFDDFLLCYSLANQTKSLYRYGSFKDCSLKFKDFKFCLSLKSLSTEERNEIWIRRRAEFWAKRRLGRSSEDVWNARPGVYDESSADKIKQMLGSSLPLDRTRRIAQLGLLALEDE